jgi:thiol-disulfide isomerase/thioredoxin
MKPSGRKAAFDSGWLTLAGVAVVALFFGAFVLPRFGRGLEGQPAPDFSMPVLSGGEPGARIRLSDQRGQVVLLDFWASWCRPCREQARVIEAMAATPAMKGVVVIGVNVSDSREAAEAYLATARPPWRIVEDESDVAHQAYRVETLPTLVLIDKRGQVFAVRRQFVSERELSALFLALSNS